MGLQSLGSYRQTLIFMYVYRPLPSHSLTLKSFYIRRCDSDPRIRASPESTAVAAV